MTDLTTFTDIFEDTNKQDELGAFYTPRTISERMVDMLNIEENQNGTVYDPTCGFCGLLITALDKKVALGIPKDIAITQVYGCELDADVLRHGLVELSNWYGKPLPTETLEHFVCCDALKFSPEVYWDDNGKPVQFDINEFVFAEKPEIIETKNLIREGKLINATQL